MKHRLILGIWLTVVWLELWGDLTWANLFSGILIAGFVVTLWAPREPLGLRVRPAALVRFVAFFTMNLLRASLEVAREVLRPHPQLREAVVAASITTTTRGMTAVIAAAISLTPGTLVIDTTRVGARTILYVHVFNLGDRAEVLADVARLEQMALAALAPTTASTPSETESNP